MLGLGGIHVVKGGANKVLNALGLCLLDNGMIPINKR